MYKQAIIIFGMVLPGGVLVVVLIVMWTMLGNFEVKHNLKIAALKNSQQNILKERLLESQLAPRRGQMAYWEGHLKKDPIQSFNENLELILQNFDTNQLSMSAARRPGGKGALGTGVEAASSVFQLAFEGGYGPMQELMTELEVRMPQLVLDRIKISQGRKTSDAGSGRSLKFELTYMAWLK